MKLLLCLIISLTTISQAHALGFTIEPFYDSMFSNSTREKNAPSGTDESSFDNGGSYFGGRIYASFKMKGQGNLYAGITGGLSAVTWTLTSPTTQLDELEAESKAPKDKWWGKHVGIIIGTFHSAFDTWVGVTSTEYKNKTNDGVFNKNDELRGMSLEVGVGMRLVSWLKLNATWRNHKLGNYRDSQNRRSYDLPDSETNEMGDYDVKEYYLGVSMPLTIGSRGK